MKLAEQAGGERPVKVSENRSSNLGIQVRPLDTETAKGLGLPEDEKGLLVIQVQPGGKAAQAGIQPGDVIKEMNRKPVRTPKDVKEEMNKVKPGEAVRMLVQRPKAGLVLLKVQV